MNFNSTQFFLYVLYQTNCIKKISIELQATKAICKKVSIGGKKPFHSLKSLARFKYLYTYNSHLATYCIHLNNKRTLKISSILTEYRIIKSTTPIPHHRQILALSSNISCVIHSGFFISSLIKSFTYR
jgi:hypothetical protein